MDSSASRVFFSMGKETRSAQSIMPTLSPRRRALGILEILELIFTFVDRSTARNCSQVCRFWREPAENAVWRHLDNGEDFGKSLLPHLVAKREDCGCNASWYRRRLHLHQSESPSDAQWQQFLSRARLVRSIAVSPDAIFRSVSDDVLEALVEARPPGVTCIFPRLRSLRFDLWNLQSFEWPMSFPRIFLHDGLQEVTLEFDGFEELGPLPDEVMDQPEVRVACRMLLRIPTLAENVTKLAIIMTDETMLSAFGRSLQHAIPHFPRLECFTTSSPRILTASIVAAMKDLRWLKTISDDKDPKHRKVRASTDAVIEDEVCFPSLEYMQIRCSLMDISSVLSDERGGFSRLTTLQISVLTSSNGKTSICAIFSIMSSRCSALEHITIVHMRGRTARIRVERPRIGKTSWHLEDMKRMKTLQIVRNRDVTISDKDLVDLVQRMPSLTTLNVGSRRDFMRNAANQHYYERDEESEDDESDDDEFNGGHGPERTDAPGVPSLSLHVFAGLTHIPSKLQYVTIRLKSWHIYGPWRSSPAGPHMRTLRKLSLGFLPMTTCGGCLQDIAHFLAQVLPPQCVLELPRPNPCSWRRDFKSGWSTIQYHLQFLRTFGHCNTGLAKKHPLAACVLCQWMNGN